MASSIILSGFVALTLTPALCALILTREQEQNLRKSWLHKLLDKFNAGFNKGVIGYDKVLQRTVSNKFVTLPLLLLFCAIAFFVNNSVPSGFIPEEDQGMVYAVIETQPESQALVVQSLSLTPNRIDSLTALLRHQSPLDNGQKSG